MLYRRDHGSTAAPSQICSKILNSTGSLDENRANLQASCP